MSDTVRFHVAPIVTFQLSQALTLVFNRENLDVLEFEPIAASMRRRCLGAWPLNTHATAALQAGLTANPHATANAIGTLIPRVRSVLSVTSTGLPVGCLIQGSVNRVE